MSISNLLSPNNYDLFCDTITTSTDIDVVSRGVRVFNGATEIFPILLKWVVRNGICTIWCPASTLATLSTTYGFFNMADSPGGTYIADLPCPDTNGEILQFPMNFVTQNIATDKQVGGYCTVDCNSGGAGLGRITFALNGTTSTSGAGPYTYAFVAGSDQFANKFGIPGFSISYPVENVI